MTPEQIIGVLRQAEVELAQGQTVSEMAAGEGIERGSLGTLLRLMLLAPDIVEAIIDRRQPAGMDLLRATGPVPGGMVRTAQGDRAWLSLSQLRSRLTTRSE